MAQLCQKAFNSVLSESLTGTQLCCRQQPRRGEKEGERAGTRNKSAANDKTNFIFHLGMGGERIFQAENGNGYINSLA